MTNWGDSVPTTVRLDAETEAIVERVARKTGRTKSSVIRDAIRRLSPDSPAKPGQTLYDRMIDSIGVGRGGPRDLAARSEEILRDVFGRRRRP
jgi:Arc/MetJ-type ribon-helix-helix transcriptional regulator